MEKLAASLGRVQELNARLDRLDDIQAHAALSSAFRARSASRQQTTSGRWPLSGGTSWAPRSTEGMRGDPMQMLRQTSRVNVASASQRLAMTNRGKAGAAQAEPSCAVALQKDMDDASIDKYLRRLHGGPSDTEAVICIQSAWRGLARRRAYLSRLHRKHLFLGDHLRAWRRLTVACVHRRQRLYAIAFENWGDDVAESHAALGTLGALLYRSRGMSATSQQWRMCVQARTQHLKYVSDHGESPAPIDGDAIGAAARDPDWVLKSLQLCAKFELRNRMFTYWKRHVRWIDRRRNQAGHRLKMCARTVQRWPTETLALCVLMWKRLTKLKLAWRRGLPLPSYEQEPDDVWNAFEELATARRERKQQVMANFDFMFKRRIWRAWRETKGGWRRAISLEPWEHHMLNKVCGTILRKWQAFTKYKLTNRGFHRYILHTWKQYARASRQLILERRATLARQQRALLALSFAGIHRYVLYRRRLAAASADRMAGRAPLPDAGAEAEILRQQGRGRAAVATKRAVALATAAAGGSSRAASAPRRFRPLDRSNAQPEFLFAPILAAVSEVASNALIAARRGVLGRQWVAGFAIAGMNTHMLATAMFYAWARRARGQLALRCFGYAVMRRSATKLMALVIAEWRVVILAARTVKGNAVGNPENGLDGAEAASARRKLRSEYGVARRRLEYQGIPPLEELHDLAHAGGFDPKSGQDPHRTRILWGHQVKGDSLVHRSFASGSWPLWQAVATLLPSVVKRSNARKVDLWDTPSERMTVRACNCRYVEEEHETSAQRDVAAAVKALRSRLQRDAEVLRQVEAGEAARGLRREVPTFTLMSEVAEHRAAMARVPRKSSSSKSLKRYSSRKNSVKGGAPLRDGSEIQLEAPSAPVAMDGGWDSSGSDGAPSTSVAQAVAAIRLNTEEYTGKEYLPPLLTTGWLPWDDPASDIEETAQVDVGEYEQGISALQALRSFGEERMARPSMQRTTSLEMIAGQRSLAPVRAETQLAFGEMLGSVMAKRRRIVGPGCESEQLRRRRSSVLAVGKLDVHSDESEDEQMREAMKVISVVRRTSISSSAQGDHQRIGNSCDCEASSPRRSSCPASGASRWLSRGSHVNTAFDDGQTGMGELAEEEPGVLCSPKNRCSPKYNLARARWAAAIAEAMRIARSNISVGDDGRMLKPGEEGNEDFKEVTKQMRAEMVEASAEFARNANEKEGSNFSRGEVDVGDALHLAPNERASASWGEDVDDVGGKSTRTLGVRLDNSSIAYMDEYACGLPADEHVGSTIADASETTCHDGSHDERVTEAILAPIADQPLWNGQLVALGLMERGSPEDALTYQGRPQPTDPRSLGEDGITSDTQCTIDASEAAMARANAEAEARRRAAAAIEAAAEAAAAEVAAAEAASAADAKALAAAVVAAEVDAAEAAVEADLEAAEAEAEKEVAAMAAAEAEATCAAEAAAAVAEAEASGNWVWTEVDSAAMDVEVPRNLSGVPMVASIEPDAPSRNQLQAVRHELKSSPALDSTITHTSALTLDTHAGMPSGPAALAAAKAEAAAARAIKAAEIYSAGIAARAAKSLQMKAAAAAARKKREQAEAAMKAAAEAAERARRSAEIKAERRRAEAEAAEEAARTAKAAAEAEWVATAAEVLVRKQTVAIEEAEKKLCRETLEAGAERVQDEATRSLAITQVNTVKSQALEVAKRDAAEQEARAAAAAMEERRRIASILIQAACRGFYVRNLVVIHARMGVTSQRARDRRAAAMTMQRIWRGRSVRLGIYVARAAIQTAAAAASMALCPHLRYAYLFERALRRKRNNEARQKAAARMTSAARVYAARRRVEELRMIVLRAYAAVVLQSFIRGERVRSKYRTSLAARAVDASIEYDACQAAARVMAGNPAVKKTIGTSAAFTEGLRSITSEMIGANKYPPHISRPVSVGALFEHSESRAAQSRDDMSNTSAIESKFGLRRKEAHTHSAVDASNTGATRLISTRPLTSSASTPVMSDSEGTSHRQHWGRGVAPNPGDQDPCPTSRAREAGALRTASQTVRPYTGYGNRRSSAPSPAAAPSRSQSAGPAPKILPSAQERLLERNLARNEAAEAALFERVLADRQYWLARASHEALQSQIDSLDTLGGEPDARIDRYLLARPAHKGSVAPGSKAPRVGGGVLGTTTRVGAWPSNWPASGTPASSLSRSRSDAVLSQQHSAYPCEAGPTTTTASVPVPPSIHAGGVTDVHCAQYAPDPFATEIGLPSSADLLSSIEEAIGSMMAMAESGGWEDEERPSCCTDEACGSEGKATSRQSTPETPSQNAGRVNSRFGGGLAVRAGATAVASRWHTSCEPRPLDSDNRDNRVGSIPMCGVLGSRLASGHQEGVILPAGTASDQSTGVAEETVAMESSQSMPHFPLRGNGRRTPSTRARSASTSQVRTGFGIRAGPRPQSSSDGVGKLAIFNGGELERETRTGVGNGARIRGVSRSRPTSRSQEQQEPSSAIIGCSGSGVGMGSSGVEHERPASDLSVVPFSMAAADSFGATAVAEDDTEDQVQERQLDSNNVSSFNARLAVTPPPTLSAASMGASAQGSEGAVEATPKQSLDAIAASAAAAAAAAAASYVASPKLGRRIPPSKSTRNFNQAQSEPQEQDKRSKFRGSPGIARGSVTDVVAMAKTDPADKGLRNSQVSSLKSFDNNRESVTVDAAKHARSAPSLSCPPPSRFALPATSASTVKAGALLTLSGCSVTRPSTAISTPGRTEQTFRNSVDAMKLGVSNGEKRRLPTGSGCSKSLSNTSATMHSDLPAVLRQRGEVEVVLMGASLGRDTSESMRLPVGRLVRHGPDFGDRVGEHSLSTSSSPTMRSGNDERVSQTLSYLGVRVEPPQNDVPRLDESASPPAFRVGQSGSIPSEMSGGIHRSLQASCSEHWRGRRRDEDVQLLSLPKPVLFAEVRASSTTCSGTKSQRGPPSSEGERSVLAPWGPDMAAENNAVDEDSLMFSASVPNGVPSIWNRQEGSVSMANPGNGDIGSKVRTGGPLVQTNRSKH